MLPEMREAFPLDPDVVGIGANLRVTALDTELLYVHPWSPASGVGERDAFAEAYPLAMNLNEGWWDCFEPGIRRTPDPRVPSDPRRSVPQQRLSNRHMATYPFSIRAVDPFNACGEAPCCADDTSCP
jgi:hypothetical protein